MVLIALVFQEVTSESNMQVEDSSDAVASTSKVTSDIKGTPASSKKKKQVSTPKKSNTPSKKKSSAKKAAPAVSESSPSATVSNENGSAKTPSSTSRKRSSKTYFQYIHEAIVALKDRTGSSIPAIKKWLLAKYPELDGPQFKHRINQAVKTGMAKKQLEKIRSSYKISAEWKAAEKKKNKSAQAKQKVAKQRAQAAEAPPKTYKELVKFHKTKLLKLSERLSGPELEKTKMQMRRKEDTLRRKEEAERKERIRLERIRKRRFPMEDTKLHAEDKELNVKPPADILSRPALPYFWQITLPLDDPNRLGKTSDAILRHSKVDQLDMDNRGLVPDLLQIYHFFRGDVHFTGDTTAMQTSVSSNNNSRRKKTRGSGGAPDPPESCSVVPNFTLSNLIYATEEILTGNARKSRLIPPLISHLFVTCLQLLCRAPDEYDNAKDARQHLQYELHKYLLPALTPASWPDVCHLYMDAMERFYSSDTSRDPNVLQPLNTDLHYLFGRVDEPIIPMTPAPVKSAESGQDVPITHPLPDGYKSYLGDFGSILYRANERLGRSEIWSLTADEILALLRSLTDDVLSSYPGIAENIAKRDEEMTELLKAKRTADSKFRKVRLAYEGPKRPSRKPVNDTTTTNGENTDPKQEEPVENTFKPTATKKEFESAARGQQKANDAYEKGIRSLVARTEPVGYDRNHHAVYCFRHDPQVLYVEELRLPMNPGDHVMPEEYQFERRSWHIIEKTSLFDSFVESLDVRGKRENDLYEAMVGAPGTQQSLRRYLHDDVKAKAEIMSRRREKEALLKRLEVAKIKCDEEQGRRSGRLADQAEEELSRAQQELDQFDDKQSQPSPRADLDYEELTGLKLLRAYEAPARRETRRAREVKEVVARPVELLPCSILVPTGNIDGSGIVGQIVSILLEMEELCESVSPSDSEDSRKTWLSKVEGTVHTWFSMTPLQIGPSFLDLEEATSNGRASLGASPSKKRRESGASSSGFGSPSVASIISALRQPLLDLEARVADITNVAVASKDAELADDNMSTSSEDAEKEENELAWKKELFRLTQITSRQHVMVRELVVKAITLARKAHASGAVAGLRAALLLYHPNAAADCRNAGIKVLEDHGGYEGDDLDDDLEEEEEGTDDKAAETAESVLSVEAASLMGCLGGSDDVSRSDWIEMVKSCKTLSRLAALTSAFSQVCESRFSKITEEKEDLLDAISRWQKNVSRARGGKKNKAEPEFNAPSEVWADVRFTEEICMVKAENWPWWPAKICEAKDDELRATLLDLKHTLVALVGENGGLRIVKEEMIRPFTGKAIADEEWGETAKKTRNELDESLTMARRIKRGMEKQKKRKNK